MSSVKPVNQALLDIATDYFDPIISKLILECKTADQFNEAVTKLNPQPSHTLAWKELIAAMNKPEKNMIAAVVNMGIENPAIIFTHVAGEILPEDETAEIQRPLIECFYLEPPMLNTLLINHRAGNGSGVLFVDTLEDESFQIKPGIRVGKTIDHIDVTFGDVVNFFLHGHQGYAYRISKNQGIERILEDGEWITVSNLQPSEVPSERFWALANRRYAESREESFNKPVQVHGSFTIKPKGEGVIRMGWSPSQEDMLSKDWMIVPLEMVQPEV